MDIEQFSRRMIELMPKCIRGFHEYESNYLSRGQISQPQFWAMEYLSRTGECLMGELAAFLHISRPAATGLIDRLIAQKLVVRRMDQKDRRTVKVGITPGGKKIVAHIWEQKRKGFVQVFSKISSNDRRQYLDILEKVVNTLSRKAVCVLAALVFFAGAAARADEAPLSDLTLNNAYQLALARSETIAIQKEVIKEAEGRFLQSLNTVLPQVSFMDSEERQDAPGHGSSQRRYVPERKFVFTQPLFSGFKEFAGIAASKAERKQRRQELVRARQLLFTDVSDAFYLLKSYQEDLQAVQDIHQALGDRIAELKKRESLGRSRASEVASAEAKFYQTEAQMELVQAQGDVARELMEFLTGQRIASLAPRDVVLDQFPPQDAYVAKAISRSDVQAAQQAALVAQKKIIIARAGYFPTVNVTGNDYLKRVGASSGVDWDITLNVTVPLFTGTQTAGDLKQAKALAKEAELALSRAKRQAVLDIQNGYTKLVQDQKQTAAFQKAVDAAQKNYDLQAADYRNSLVNNLDVLQALADLETVRRGYIAVKNETQRFYWGLKVATGDLSDDTL